MKFKREDPIQVISGRDKGLKGKIQRVYRQSGLVLIENVNMVKKHVKKNEKMPQGGIINVPRPFSISKIGFICPKCKKTVKLGFQINDGKKNRICRSCHSII